MPISCPQCASDDLEVDPSAPPGPGIATHCLACDHRWRRPPRQSCPRCGSSDVETTAVDGWAYDDLEEARDNPGTDAWAYVDKTVFTCQKCRNVWQVAGESRPYRPS